MIKQYKTVYTGGQGEIIERKSRFLAVIRPVEEEAAAIAFIAEIKKAHWNATHNCYAYVIGENNTCVRCSDDGEPSGTAGKPMLDVLLGQELHNTAVVVTRYFGGTLLGTGGLVRAYSQAVQAGLLQSKVITKQHGVQMGIDTDYNGVGKLQYLFGQKEIPILDAQYTEAVRMEILVPAGRTAEITEAVTEATGGRVGIENMKELYYAVVDKELICFG